VLHSFEAPPNGAYPSSGVTRDTAGNLYGTTSNGGTSDVGVVYKLGANGQEPLYSFTGGSDGKYPEAGVILDPEGNLYGTTAYGGTANAGVVYKVGAGGGETVLYTFSGGADGANPNADLLRDSAGNLYGTTTYGGAGGAGTVFKLDATGGYAVLYSFTGGADGGYPDAAVIRDSAGNLHGTANGGMHKAGVVFKVNPTGHETVLYGFTGLGPDGISPGGGVIRDSAGNLYGTAGQGGKWSQGVVFKVDMAGQETVLYSFSGPDGAVPRAGLIRNSAGNLYGTTWEGGTADWGVVFELDVNGHETVLYSFTGGPTGGSPWQV
jgi:uncharacterized repeat protein (TIGR03803 family)